MRMSSVPTLMSCLALAALLAGCAGSPPARYYTLQAPPPAAPPQVPRAPYQIELVPVSVPLQADQPQIMLRGEDGALSPLYSDRWSAPLADEIGTALSDTLTRTLGALNVQALKPADGAPVWRVQVDVQGFDMPAGGPVRLDATWRARPIHIKGAAALMCRSIVTVAADGQDIPALVRAQQRAVALLGGTIASAIQAGGAAARPAGPEVQLRGCT